MAIHKRCLAARKKAGISARQLSERSGLSRNTISKMESPAAEAGIFTINQYNKYARGVNAAPEWLIFGDLIDRLVFAELRRIKSEVDLLLESEISRKRLS